jgi:polyribonucleotide nucleotidyltransferase
MIVVQIPVGKIKDVIGPGGKMINKIIDECGVEKIDIEDDGKVFITALDGESGEKAKATIEALTKDILAGEVYTGVVTRVIAIGAFVQIAGGKEGLVHISQIAPERVAKVEDVLNVGDEVKVKVMEVDGQGRLNLSRKALMPGGESAGDDSGGRRPFRPRTGPPSGDRDRGPRHDAAPRFEPREEAPSAPAADLSGELPRRPRRRRHGGADSE